MLIASIFRTNVQADSRTPEKKHARKDGRQQDAAQDQDTRKAKSAEKDIRQPSRIAAGPRRDVNHDRRVGLLLKSREEERSKQFP